jgi:alpha-glucan,water dikinase
LVRSSSEQQRSLKNTNLKQHLQIHLFFPQLTLHLFHHSISTGSLVTSAAASVAQAAPPKVLSEQRFDEMNLMITVTEDAATDSFTAKISTLDGASRPDLVLHWAINDWVLPAQQNWPQGTNQAGDKAVQTPFAPSNEVSITFSGQKCPSRVVFVLKEGEKWMNSGGGDFVAHLKPPSSTELVDKVIEAESEYERWSLFSRFCMASQLLTAASAAGPPGMALILTWLRLSSQRQLPWYKGTNYQSKDAAHAQKTLAQGMADTVRRVEDPLSRTLARAAMAGLPRGGGNGDDIRHGILDIMRSNGIREGHRPGIEDHFLESWHQKLHTNTTPEDVTICEAYLAFLRSGDMGEFWRVAWERGNITPETLANMDHPINPCPCHLPHLIGPFEGYLWTLKTTHAGADLDIAYTMAQGHMDGELSWIISDILANRNEWWVPGKIVEARRRLVGVWMSPGAPRDVLLLDIALDAYFRLCVERTDKSALSDDDVISLIGLVLDNATVVGDNEELMAATAQWHRVASHGDRWGNKEWGKMALAAADFTALCLEGFADDIVRLVQPLADRFGAACDIDQAYIMNFGEEVVRSQPLFILSPLLQRLGPSLRAAADVGAWQVVSQGSGVAAGKLISMPDLSSIQGKPPAEPVAILVEKLTGNEDIPENVVAVITGSATDVLSHVAIRARAQNVLLASCFDPNILEALRSELEGKAVEVGVTPTGDVAAIVSTAAGGKASSSSSASKSSGSSSKLTLDKPSAVGKKTTPWVLTETEFVSGAVGGKGLNLSALRGKLPATVGMPSSIAFPFGTFERVLSDSANATVAKAVAAAEKELAATKAGTGIPAALRVLRQTIRTELTAPADLISTAATAAASTGLIASATEWTAPGSIAWDETWAAVCKVWASKWNDRAWLSRQSQGVKESDLYMSVLVQEVIPAAYAFVLHTADPLTGEAGKLHGELVVGMGEALVGNYPGRALSFTATNKGQNVEVSTFPSKRQALRADMSSSGKLLIARSDSNGEDLEEFAGAGLYSSVPLTPFKVDAVKYAEDALIWDGETRTAVLGKLAAVGAAVEAACGSPQDIEGVVDGDGNVAVVQARPQVIRD